MSSSDDIRAKRLAKLVALEKSNSSSSDNASKDSKPESESNATSSPTTAFPKVEVKKEQPVSNPKADKFPSVHPQSDISTEVMSPEEQISEWLSVEMKNIFEVTIDKSQSGSLLYLPALASDVNSDNVLLSEEKLEDIYMEILTEVGVPASYKSTMEYLFYVYIKSIRSKRYLLKKTTFYEAKSNILSKIIDLSSSFGFICFQVPDMFLNNDIHGAIDFIIKSHISGSDIVPFLIDIINQSIEQESLLELLNIFFPVLSSKIYKIGLNDSSYSSYLSIFEALVNIKPVAAIFSQVDGFQPPNKDECLDFEHKTLLGPLFRLSPLLEDVSEYYFTQDMKNVSKVQINSAYESLQNEFKVVSDRLFYIVDKLIRGSSQTRQSILRWLSDFINLNHLRRGSHADLKKLASDGIMFNISVILIKLSMPFLDYPTYSKINKIDIDYFGKNDYLNISEESRVNSSIQEANHYYKGKEVKSNTNFISDCFFLTLTYLHYGIGGIFIHFDRLKNQIKQYNERIEMIENNRLPQGSNPMVMQLMKSQLPKLNKALNALKTTKHAIQAIFSFRSLQLEIFDFVVGSSVFIVNAIDPTHQYPQTKLSIPIFKIDNVSELDDHDFLMTKTPQPWKYYPEYILEGIINYCKFVTNFRGSPLIQNYEKLESIVEFSVILLRCPELIGNPHMKAHLVEVLFMGSLPMTDGSPGFISPIFNSNKLVIDNILYSLLDFYVMVEKTGASSQFYDKFNSRYYISVILEELWKNELYRNQLTSYSTNNVDFFIRFIARMLNDTTYLLDETFNELNSIHNYQQELKNRSNGMPENTEDFGTNEELTNNLNSSERKAKSYMGLTNKTIELFKLFTKEVPQGFILPEIVDRLAGMLNYNLSVMVGPKCSNLKVENPDKYDFHPKKTLHDLCEIYCNLANQEKFVIATSRDGRSFNIAYFRKADRILSTKTYTDSLLIKRLFEFAEKAEAQRQNDEDEEMELGEVPDEFLDPLMFTIMEEPVILPGSKISIDRSTIKAHLLSDATDPFNRMPLKLDDVEDDVELQKRIKAFKLQKKAERKSQIDVEMEDA